MASSSCPFDTSSSDACLSAATVSVTRLRKTPPERESGPPLPVARILQLEEPWVLAKNRFLADLSEEEKAVFNKATLENLYYSTSNLDRKDRDESKSRVAIQKLQPLVSAIESYGKAFDTISNVAPLYLAPLWGSIRVLLVVARSYGRFYEKIVDTLSRIGDIIPHCRRYSDDFGHSLKNSF